MGAPPAGGTGAVAAPAAAIAAMPLRSDADITHDCQSLILRSLWPSAPPTASTSTTALPWIASRTTAGSGVIIRIRLKPAMTGRGIQPSASMRCLRNRSLHRFSTEK